MFSLSVVVDTRGGDGRAHITTYAVRQGRYGSIGHVSVDAEGVQPPTTLEEVARLLLTGLYGLDYDL